MIKLFCGLLFLCLVEPRLANTGQQDDVVTGSIKGTVFTHSGSPALNISVLIEGVYPPATLRTLITTDEHGTYHADKLMLGQYVLYPYGEYPGFIIRHNMFLDASPVRVTISKAEPEVSKNLILPLEAAVIHGQIANHLGMSITGSKVVICHASEVTRSAQIVADDTGRFSYIVPSDERLSVLIVTPSGARMQQTDISLKPGENREMVFNIDRTSKIAGAACVPFQ